MVLSCLSFQTAWDSLRYHLWLRPFQTLAGLASSRMAPPRQSLVAPIAHVGLKWSSTEYWGQARIADIGQPTCERVIMLPLTADIGHVDIPTQGSSCAQNGGITRSERRRCPTFARCKVKLKVHRQDGASCHRIQGASSGTSAASCRGTRRGV